MLTPLARPLLACTMALFASSAVAMPQRVYVKQPPAAAAQMDADHDDCVRQTLATMNGLVAPIPRPESRTSREAIANAFDLKRPRMAVTLEVRCMAEKGYTLLSLTPQEDKALSKAHGKPARDAWYEALVATNLSARVAAAP